MANKTGRGRGQSRSKARKGEAKAEAKKNEAEVRKASDTIALPLPKQADIMAAINDVKGWNAKLETIKSKRQLALKSHKAKGISSAQINGWIALERGDADEFRRYLEGFSVGCEALGMPFRIVVSDTLFADAVEQARNEARLAARSGKSPECRWAEGTPEHEGYMEAYARQQAVMVPGAENLTDDEREDAVSAGEAARPLIEHGNAEHAATH